MDKNSISQEMNSIKDDSLKIKESLGKFNFNKCLDNAPTVQKLSIYAATWNLHGKSAKIEDIRLLLPKKEFYHMYVIGTEECMRSILTSLIFSDKSGWETMLE